MNESTNGQGMRTATRVKYSVSLAYSLDIPDQREKKFPRFRFGTLLDISERGICFKANEEFSPHRLMSLYLKLSDDTSGIRMLGKVVWTKKDWDGQSLTGVQFIGTLPPDWREIIHE